MTARFDEPPSTPPHDLSVSGLGVPSHATSALEGELPLSDVDLRATVRRDGARVVVRLAGELCEESAPLISVLLARLAEGDRPVVVVDLRDLSLLSAPGISALVDGRRDCEEAGGSLTLANARGLVATVLEVCEIPLDAG